jgi:hypothetical protein
MTTRPLRPVIYQTQNSLKTKHQNFPGNSTTTIFNSQCTRDVYFFASLHSYYDLKCFVQYLCHVVRAT